MKKKILSLLLITICITLVGCGKKDSSTENSGGKTSKIEYKDYNEDGKINYEDKMYAISQASGFNIEYKGTANEKESTHQISAKKNLILFLNNDEGYLSEYTGETGNLYKKENGTWKDGGKIFKNALFKDGVEEAYRKDIYAKISSFASSMDKYLINDSNKKEEVTYLGRKCTKYVNINSYNNEETVIYVDNETELPLYYKNSTRTVEVTKFETKTELSIPQI